MIITNVTEAPPILDVRGIVKTFPVKTGPLGRKRAVRSVDGISFSVAEGEVLGIVGESGCGKSTLARLLLRILSPDEGKIRFAGQDIGALRGRQLRDFRQGVQIIFQDPFAALDPRMTIGDSLDAPLQQNGVKNREERSRRIAEMLEAVGLDVSFLPRVTSECSGGQLQRVVIARALLLRPRLLICDEPTSALDASIRAQVLNLLLELKTMFGLTLLVISHDLKVISEICDRVIVMYLGKVVELGASTEMFKDARHPYTQSLMQAALLHGPCEGLGSAIKGEMPSPIDPPSGCHLHPRCPRAAAACAVDYPSLSLRNGRMVACHLA